MVNPAAVAKANAAANRRMTVNEAATINNGSLLATQCQACEDIGAACYADAGAKCGRCSTRKCRCIDVGTGTAFTHATLGASPRLVLGSGLPYGIQTQVVIPAGITITRPASETSAFEVPHVGGGAFVHLPVAAPAPAPVPGVAPLDPAATRQVLRNLSRAVFGPVAGPIALPATGLVARVLALENALAAVQSCNCGVGGVCGGAAGGHGAGGGVDGGVDGAGGAAAARSQGCLRDAACSKLPGHKGACKTKS